MKIGEYARTKDGYISKITDNFCTLMKIATNKGKHIYDYIDIRKSSPNIIDLIEVGDYVNGYLVTAVSKDVYGEIIVFVGQKLIEEAGYYRSYYSKDIKTIVTKEQFKGVEYRMGDNK